MAIERQTKVGVPAEPSLEKTSTFLNEVWTELKKTTWPTKQEALRLTYVVIGVICVLGVYMWGLDALMNALVTRFVHH
jgi:preprotein translocase subunit SecE